MDYSIVLAEISSSLKLINNGLNCLIVLFIVFLIYSYIRLIVKH